MSAWKLHYASDSFGMGLIVFSGPDLPVLVLHVPDLLVPIRTTDQINIRLRRNRSRAPLDDTFTIRCLLTFSNLPFLIEVPLDQVIGGYLSSSVTSLLTAVGRQVKNLQT